MENGLLTDEFLLKQRKNLKDTIAKINDSEHKITYSDDYIARIKEINRKFGTQFEEPRQAVSPPALSNESVRELVDGVKNTYLKASVPRLNKRTQTDLKFKEMPDDFSLFKTGVFVPPSKEKGERIDIEKGGDGPPGIKEKETRKIYSFDNRKTEKMRSFEKLRTFDEFLKDEESSGLFKTRKRCESRYQELVKDQQLSALVSKETKILSELENITGIQDRLREFIQ